MYDIPGNLRDCDSVTSHASDPIYDTCREDGGSVTSYSTIRTNRSRPSLASQQEPVMVVQEAETASVISSSSSSSSSSHHTVEITEVEDAPVREPLYANVTPKKRAAPPLPVVQQELAVPDTEAEVADISLFTF